MSEVYKKGWGVVMKCPGCKTSFYKKRDTPGLKRLKNGQLIREKQI